MNLAHFSITSVHIIDYFMTYELTENSLESQTEKKVKIEGFSRCISSYKQQEKEFLESNSSHVTKNPKIYTEK